MYGKNDMNLTGAFIFIGAVIVLVCVAAGFGLAWWIIL